MGMRYYQSDYSGSGTPNDPFTVVAVTAIRTAEPSAFCVFIDGRPSPTSAAGVALVIANVADATHATVNGTAGVAALNITNASNVPLGPTATLSQMSAAKRTTLRDALEARHVPLADLGTSNTVRDVLDRIVGRFLVRQVLAALDYNEGLDTLVSDVPSGRRTQLSQALQAVGFTTGGVTGSMTMRQALATIIIDSKGRHGLNITLPGE